MFHNVFDNTDAGDHVEWAFQLRLQDVVVDNVPVPVHHTARPVIPDVVDGCHDATAVADQMRKRRIATSYVQDASCADPGKALKQESEFNGSFVNAVELLTVVLSFCNLVDIGLTNEMDWAFPD